MALNGRCRYSTSCYAVEPRSSRIVEEISWTMLTTSQPNHLVYNIGRCEIFAELIYGTPISWTSALSVVKIQPGEKSVLDHHAKFYYRLGVKIYNKTATRAIVHVSDEHGNYSSVPLSDKLLNIDRPAIVKRLVIFGVKYMPFVGSTLPDILETFWPQNKPGIWEEVQDNVKLLADDRIWKTVEIIFLSEFNYYKERIATLCAGRKRNSASCYMDLARDLVGLERRTSFGHMTEDLQKHSYAFLPIYSASVLLKMHFYRVGVTKSDDLGLTDDEVLEIKEYTDRLLNGESGVIKYISAMYTDRVNAAYSTTDPDDIYSTMMDVRNRIALSGLRLIPTWISMLCYEGKPFFTQPYQEAVIYSSFHGRPSPDLHKQAIAEEITQPLTPNIIEGNRNKLLYVELHMWRTDNGRGPEKIGGLKVIFENGDNYIMGTNSWEIHKVDFKDSRLVKLRVSGEDVVDRLTFYFSDGRQVSYGTEESDTVTMFELDNYYIASLFLASDGPSLGGQAVNVCVSYLPCQGC